MYNFEFDQNKSSSNLKKHGIDFVHAQQIWNDPDFVEVQAKSGSELRFLVMGYIADKQWSAVITYRQNNIRIISVRRSRTSEGKLYAS